MCNLYNILQPLFLWDLQRRKSNSINPSKVFTPTPLISSCCHYLQFSFHFDFLQSPLKRTLFSELNGPLWIVSNVTNFPLKFTSLFNLLLCLFSSLPIDISNVAVVYAGPTFHDEVASVAACILHDLGYYVVVYIGNGIHFGGMMVPFSGADYYFSFVPFPNDVSRIAS